MKAVIVDVPPSMIEERRRQGVDRRDEVWEGVYHMVPPPNFSHQHIVTDLLYVLETQNRRHELGTFCLGAGVRDLRHPSKNYRIPEWLFLRKGRLEAALSGDGYVDQGPDVALEVRSPGDETDEKIPFYEKVGTLELLIVDRDTRRVDLLRLMNGRLTAVSPEVDGWLRCEGLRAYFRTVQRGGKAALLVRLELEKTEHAV